MPQTCTNRIDLMQISRNEYESIVTSLRLRHALHSATPNETVIDLTPGDEVLVYREKKLAGMAPIHSYTVTGNYPLYSIKMAMNIYFIVQC